MRARRKSRLLVEPPSAATGDIAFNLIVFFLVCASVAPDSGRKQEIPSSETVQEKAQESKNVEVQITPASVAIDGDFMKFDEFPARIAARLKGRSAKPEDRIVVVKSKPETPYEEWIRVTSWIDDAGGIVTLQLEEEREVVVP